MKYPVLNYQGEKVSEIDLPKELFDIPLNQNLVWQVMVSQRSNRRQSIAHTKDRSEVSGGGRKPWPQKGTGRARHGSIRSPLWKGGGVTFGPRKEKNFKKKIPKKMRRKALFMVLSEKAREKLLILLDKLEMEKIKTKIASNIFRNLVKDSKKTLLVLPDNEKKIILSFRNIPNLKIEQAKDLNCLDLLNSKYIIMPVKSIDVLKKTFIKK